MYAGGRDVLTEEHDVRLEDAAAGVTVGHHEVVGRVQVEHD